MKDEKNCVCGHECTSRCFNDIDCPCECPTKEELKDAEQEVKDTEDALKMAVKDREDSIIWAEKMRKNYENALINLDNLKK